MKHVAVTCNMPVKDLLEKVAWVMYEEYAKDEDNIEGHALDTLEEILKYAHSALNDWN